jgi:hypothetical protein
MADAEPELEIMRLKQYITETKFTDEVTASYSGQSNSKITAFENGKPVGYLEYTVYRDEVQISYVKSDKPGTGTKLVLYLQSQFPKTEIDWGMMTGDGAKLQKKLQSKLYVDHKLRNEIKSLKAEYAKLEKEEKVLMKKFDQGHIKITPKEGERLNYISDRKWDIEERLHQLSL